jgi:hypothetical protein
MSDPKTVDPMEAECANALRREVPSAGKLYATESAREFLAMYRLVERKKPSPVPQMLAEIDECTRIVKLIRSKLGAHIRYIDDMNNSDIIRSAAAACALQGILDEIDPDFQGLGADEDMQAGAI